MKKVTLANTNIQVSQLGLGTVKFGRNRGVKYPQQFKIPNDNEVIEFLSLAKSLGINLIDTAPAYGNSEERIGKLLPGKREDWVICSKAGEEFDGENSSYHFSKDEIEQSVKRSLKRLNTDYLDILLIHSDGHDSEIIEKYDVFYTLNLLKQQGLIRAFGMSTKTIEGGLKTVEQADVVMASYNPLYTDELAVIKAAYQANKAVFIKKAFASGHLQNISHDNPAKACLNFIFKEPGVSSVIIGTINPQHLRDNVALIA